MDTNQIEILSRKISGIKNQMDVISNLDIYDIGINLDNDSCDMWFDFDFDNEQDAESLRTIIKNALERRLAGFKESLRKELESGISNLSS